MNSENVKFLGVNLDSALSFRGYNNEIHAKYSKLINYQILEGGLMGLTSKYLNYCIQVSNKT